MKVKDMCFENCKTLMREIKDDTRRWKIYYVQGVIEYRKNDHFTQGNLLLQCNSCQNTKVIFHRTRTRNLKFVWKHKIPQTAKTILTKNRAGRTMLPNCRKTSPSALLATPKPLTV